MVFKNLQAIYGSGVMVIFKDSDPCLMATDVRAFNDTIEPAATSMRNLEDRTSSFAGATVRSTLEMLQGCWQMPLSEDAQEIVHHGHAGGVVHAAPCTTGGFERYRIFPGDDG